MNFYKKEKEKNVFVTIPEVYIRSAASEALACVLEGSSSAQVASVLDQLIDTYTEKLELTPPVVDQLGHVITPQLDHWEPRCGVAVALGQVWLANFFFLFPLYNKLLIAWGVNQ